MQLEIIFKILYILQGFTFKYGYKIHHNDENARALNALCCFFKTFESKEFFKKPTVLTFLLSKSMVIKFLQS